MARQRKPKNATEIPIGSRRPSLAPGTQLPLLVKRGDQALEIVARFPSRQ